MAALPSLRSRCLILSAFEQESAAQLSLLAACPSRPQLTLRTLSGNAPLFSDTQVAQIRSSLGDLRHFSVGRMTSDVLARFLKPPVTARWQDIGQVLGDTRIGELLRLLPTLSRLDLTSNHGTVRVDFLTQLPQLTALRLEGYFFPADTVLASLVLCSCITELNLTSGFTSADWSALFAKLPLRILTIRGRVIETLRFLAEGPITQSLEELSIQCIVLPPAEISHLYALGRLRTLRLNWEVCSRLADATITSMSPPTALLPALTLFHHWQTASGESIVIERKGVSFEWMQQRRTH